MWPRDGRLRDPEAVRRLSTTREAPRLTGSTRSESDRGDTRYRIGRALWPTTMDVSTLIYHSGRRCRSAVRHLGVPESERIWRQMRTTIAQPASLGALESWHSRWKDH